MKEKFAAAVGKIICLSVEGIKEIMLLLSVFSASPGVVGNEQKKFLRYAEKAGSKALLKRLVSGKDGSRGNPEVS